MLHFIYCSGAQLEEVLSLAFSGNSAQEPEQMPNIFLQNHSFSMMQLCLSQFLYFSLFALLCFIKSSKSN